MNAEINASAIYESTGGPYVHLSVRFRCCLCQYLDSYRANSIKQPKEFAAYWKATMMLQALAVGNPEAGRRSVVRRKITRRHDTKR